MTSSARPSSESALSRLKRLKEPTRWSPCGPSPETRLVCDMARQLSKTQVRRAIEIGGERLNALALAEVEARTRDDFVRVIWNLWEDARQRFLLIGRYLNRAREALSHGEWGEMVRNDLPFSVAVADQFRTIAKAVDDGTF